MKVSLNASVRDAQLRDSFNKESVTVTVNEDAVISVIEYLYKVQSQTPRNASKLHSLVVVDSKGMKLFLLNFEVLRSIQDTFESNDLFLFVDESKNKRKSAAIKKEVEENDN